MKNLFNSSGKSKKILVQYLNMDKSTTWKKYPVDHNYKVLIREGGGAGVTKIEPTLTPECIFTKGLFRTPYVIYSHGSDHFLNRTEENLPNFSMKTVKDFLNAGIFEWIRSALRKQDPFILYILLGLNGIILFIMLQGFGIINIR